MSIPNSEFQFSHFTCLIKCLGIADRCSRNFFENWWRDWSKTISRWTYEVWNYRPFMPWNDWHIRCNQMVTAWNKTSPWIMYFNLFLSRNHGSDLMSNYMFFEKVWQVEHNPKRNDEFAGSHEKNLEFDLMTEFHFCITISKCV